MIAIDQHRVSAASPGVEVVTSPTADGGFVSTINGGPLDGEQFVGNDGRQLHKLAMQLAQGPTSSRRRSHDRIA